MRIPLVCAFACLFAQALVAQELRQVAVRCRYAAEFDNMFRDEAKRRASEAEAAMQLAKAANDKRHLLPWTFVVEPPGGEAEGPRIDVYLVEGEERLQMQIDVIDARGEIRISRRQLNRTVLPPGDLGILEYPAADDLPARVATWFTHEFIEARAARGGEPAKPDQALLHRHLRECAPVAAARVLADPDGDARFGIVLLPFDEHKRWSLSVFEIVAHDRAAIVKLASRGAGRRPAPELDDGLLVTHEQLNEKDIEEADLQLLKRVDSAVCFLREYVEVRVGPGDRRNGVRVTRR